MAGAGVWPNFFLKNIFFALKGSKLFIIIWLGIHSEPVKDGYDEVPSMVEAVPKAKMGLSCTELLKTMAENDKIMF